ncbi:MAG: hypothetical protein ACPF9Q_06355, partial [Opitutales bacterium]
MKAKGAVEFPLFERLQSWAVALLVLLGAALVLKPVKEVCWEAVQAGQAELRVDSLDESVGQGVVLGVLGGLRSLVADFAWLELNRKWEARDRAGLGAMIQLVTSIDPRPEFFWINSARMIGYDVPHWRIAEAGGYGLVPETEQAAINAEQAIQAAKLAVLKRQEEERQRQEEAVRLAELKRQEEERQRRQSYLRLRHW